MKTYAYLFAASVLAASMVGCANDSDLYTSGSGSLTISATINSDVTTLSRTASDDLSDIYGESLQLWISNDKGLIRQYSGLDNLPTSPLALLAGSYVAEAWAGDSVSASWDKKWFKGRQPFTITKDQTTTVAVECKIANVVVAVEYDDDVKAVLGDDISLQVSHSRGSLTFEGYDIDGKNAYFMMPSTDTDLLWTLQGTKRSDGVTLFTRSNTVANVQPAHRYVFHVSCQSTDTDDLGGGYGLEISIDDTEIYVAESVQISVAPTIKGGAFDIDMPIYSAPGQVGQRNIYIFGSEELSSVMIESNKLGTLIGIDGADDVDLLNMSDSFKSKLVTAGLSYTYSVDSEGASRMKITLSDTFTANMTSGAYTFTITAIDASGRKSIKTLTFDVSGAPLSPAASSVVDLATYSNRTTISGRINNIPDSQPIYVDYREANARSRDDDWTTVEAVVSGINFSAEITGLTAGTTYQWRVRSGDYISDIATITTEQQTQLPNCGFEDWQTSKSPYMIYPANGDKFWDSGNTGSATMNKNVTVPESTIKHSGNYSAGLKSQFVGIGTIGKFAAGNIFIGEYLDTQGTDGVLGWGRPFASRPVKLRGYIHYTPAAIGYVNSDAPEYVKGQMDSGIIYMALLDDYTETYTKGGVDYHYPVIIKTKASERNLFNSNSPHVIAYGEKVFTTATEGTEMVPFEIEFDYHRTDKRPSYILITASASKGGDYFCGGASTMYIDDLELVYE